MCNFTVRYHRAHSPLSVSHPNASTADQLFIKRQKNVESQIFILCPCDMGKLLSKQGFRFR